MSRSLVLVRALRLLALMQGQAVRPTAPQVAEALGISLRHAKRYLAALNEAHIGTPPTVRDVEAA